MLDQLDPVNFGLAIAAVVTAIARLIWVLGRRRRRKNDDGGGGSSFPPF